MQQKSIKHVNKLKKNAVVKNEIQSIKKKKKTEYNKIYSVNKLQQILEAKSNATATAADSQTDRDRHTMAPHF